MRSLRDSDGLMSTIEAIGGRCLRPSRPIGIQVMFVALLLLVSSTSLIPLLLVDESSDNISHVSASLNKPRFRGTPPVDGYYADAGKQFNISYRVYDLDNNTINATWRWGDGTPDSTNTTPPAYIPQYINQTHVYDPVREPGMGNYYVNFTLNTTLEDGTGNFAWREVIVHVLIPDNIAPAVEMVQPEGKFDPSDSVQIAASATDAEGEALTWTFIFNNGVSDYYTEVWSTSAVSPGQMVWQNTSHVFGAEGTYSVRVQVTDRTGANQSAPSHNITGGPITITVVENTPPSVSSDISMSSSNPVIIDAISGYTNIKFSIDARDRDGEAMNVSWDFDDGTPSAYNESAGGIDSYTFVQWRNYSVTGQHNVSVIVTDGRPGHSVLRYLVVNVTSTNMPPGIVTLVYNLSRGVYALPNETVNFTLVLSDQELNPLEITVDFGDNSTILWFNATVFVDGNTTLMFNHSYAAKGNYTLTITYTDNRAGLFNHSKFTRVTIKIDVPPEVVVNTWSWWDYTSLFLILMIPVLVALRLALISRQRRRLEDKGYSLEEWKLMKSVMQSEKKGKGGS